MSIDNNTVDRNATLARLSFDEEYDASQMDSDYFKTQKL